jgi:hypothetical protein
MYFVKQISRKNHWNITNQYSEFAWRQNPKKLKRFSTNEEGKIGCPETSIKNTTTHCGTTDNSAVLNHYDVPYIAH